MSGTNFGPILGPILGPFWDPFWDPFWVHLGSHLGIIPGASPVSEPWAPRPWPGPRASLRVWALGPELGGALGLGPGPGMGLGSGTGHIRLGPGPWAMIPSRQPGHGFETAGPSVLPPPSLVSAFATCCVPRLLQQVELHAVWLLQPVRLPPSVTVIGICLVQPKTKQHLPGTIVGTQNCS